MFKSKRSYGEFLQSNENISTNILADRLKKLEAAGIAIKKTKIIKPNYFFLTKNSNLKEAAKNLYSMLRLIKKSKFKSIAVQKIPYKGLGKTINDRLIRASKF